MRDDRVAYLVRRQVIDGKRPRTSCYSLSRVANLSPCRSLADDGTDSGAAAVAGRLDGGEELRDVRLIKMFAMGNQTTI